MKDMAEQFSAREKTLRQVYRREGSCAATASFLPLAASGFSYRDSLEDYELMLQETQQSLALLCKADFDMMPVVNTYCSVGMVAQAFGSEILFPDGGFPWAGHVTDNAALAADIIPQKLEQLSYYQRLRGWIDFYQKKGDSDFPFWTIDIQSPFTVATQIVAPEALMLACYDNPASVHRLLAHITEYTLQLQDDHIRQMENAAFPGRNYPSIRDDIGICLADDTPAVMLSEAMYREFALPYNNIVGRHYGGVHLHSCGNYKKNLGAVLDIENLCSLQLHAGEGEFALPPAEETDAAFARAAQSVVLFVDNNPISRTDRYSGARTEFYQDYLLPRLAGIAPRWLILESDLPEDRPEMSGKEQVEQSRRFLEQLGY